LKIYLGSLKRPHYAFGVYSAALQAKALGMSRISVVEFGVASGHGLLNLESLTRRIGRYFDVVIDVHGFDMGTGLPRPVDYRDVPYTFGEGDYGMDEASLRSRLNGTNLWIGPVAETVSRLETASPLGFISFDLDLYTSTVDALRVFDFAPETRLPRVICYFDDVLGPDMSIYSDATGELLAIQEFNERQTGCMNLSQWRSLSYSKMSRMNWHAQMYVLHDFQHPAYGKSFLPDSRRQMAPL
jgi:hypothetical protein